MLENKELIISLILIIAFVIVVTYLLTKFLINNKADKMYSAWRDIKKENAKYRGIDRKFQILTLKHSGLISKLRNDKTLSKQTREYIKEYI